MDEYEIEDSITGIKLHVAGDKEPTQQDAHELVQKEFHDLSTNLHEFSGGKFILNVSPTQPVAQRWSGSLKEQLAEVDLHSKQRKDIINSIKLGDREPIPGFQNRLSEALANYDKTNKPSAVLDTKAAYSRIADKVPENTLVLMSHGGTSPNSFETDWGHKFTLSNVASLLGNKTNTVQKIINGACYGAACAPEDYKSVFPFVDSVHHVDTNFLNKVSLNDEMVGNFIPTNKVEWQYIPDDVTGVPSWKRLTQP